MDPVVIRVSTPKVAQVQAQPVRPVTITPSDGARVVVVAVPGLRGPAGPSGDGTGVFGETPAGVKDGVNVTFTLAETPQPTSVALYRNGLREHLGVGFTVSGSIITISTAPLSSDEIVVDYLMEG